MKSAKLLVGVDVGGTKIRAGVAKARRKLLAREEMATSAGDGPEAVTGRIVSIIKTCIQKALVRLKEKWDSPIDRGAGREGEVLYHSEALGNSPFNLEEYLDRKSVV